MYIYIYIYIEYFRLEYNYTVIPWYCARHQGTIILKLLSACYHYKPSQK